MASVYEHRGKWYLRFRDHRGKWRSKATSAESKTEARRMAQELGIRHERQRFGLEARPPEDGGGTLAELMKWWLETYSSKTPSHDRNLSSVTKHFLEDPIGEQHLDEITSAVLESYIEDKATELSAQTVNHLRRFILTAFNCARRAGRWTGPNPAIDIKPRRVPKRKPDFLRVDEVPLVLAATP